jgi:hypothetical protein
LLTDKPTALDRTIGYCLDYTKYTYDHDMNPNTADIQWPSCKTLTSADLDHDGVADTIQWGCAPAP